jgi:hypothetical protein
MKDSESRPAVDLPDEENGIRELLRRPNTCPACELENHGLRRYCYKCGEKLPQADAPNEQVGGSIGGPPGVYTLRTPEPQPEPERTALELPPGKYVLQVPGPADQIPFEVGPGDTITFELMPPEPVKKSAGLFLVQLSQLIADAPEECLDCRLMFGNFTVTIARKP